MKVLLMYPNRDFDLDQPLPPNTEDITHDLALDVIWNAMANGDEFLFNAARVALLSSLHADIPTIRHRQEVLADCIENTEVIKQIYELVVRTIESERREFWGFGRYPGAILSRAIGVLRLCLESLSKLREIANHHRDKFHSPGFSQLFSMLERELNDDYFSQVWSELKNLEFKNGVLVSAALGRANKGMDYVLREPAESGTNWLRWLWPMRHAPQTYYLHPRDEAGANALSNLRSRGINLVANAAGQSADHILNFFRLFRAEIAFYLGCVNLYEHLTEKGEPVCFPAPADAGSRNYAARELYDVSLALSLEQRVVGNRVNANGKELVVITGANQGGKSTFLRSAGLAQVMMQSGMFVGADAFEAELSNGIFTHYKHEEDTAMESGKFDEEINRMSDIANYLEPNALVLFNESFAATNELEGSEVAFQIVTALLHKSVKVFFVTHLYELAHRLEMNKPNRSLFLRAERREDATRTFRLVEGEPERTSYGEDLYNAIFKQDSENRVRQKADIPEHHP